MSKKLKIRQCSLVYVTDEFLLDNEIGGDGIWLINEAIKGDKRSRDADDDNETFLGYPVIEIDCTPAVLMNRIAELEAENKAMRDAVKAKARKKLEYLYEQLTQDQIDGIMEILETWWDEALENN